MVSRSHRGSLTYLLSEAPAHHACVMPGHDHKLCHEGATPLRDEPKLRVGGTYD